MGKRACGFVIFRRFHGQIEYLLMQTSYGQNHWTPPKGLVDPGESDMVTALRETQEEAGYTKEDLKIHDDAKYELNYDAYGVPKVVVYWLAELINKNKEVTLSKEHQDFKWLTLNDACVVGHFKDLTNSLNYFDRYITKNLVNKSCN